MHSSAVLLITTIGAVYANRFACNRVGADLFEAAYVDAGVDWVGDGGGECSDCFYNWRSNSPTMNVNLIDETTRCGRIMTSVTFYIDMCTSQDLLLTECT